jgi:uncharacterized membrane protein
MSLPLAHTMQAAIVETKMRYVIAVLALAGIAASSLALAGRYAAPVQPIDLLRSHWNSAYVNQSSYAEVYGIPVAALGIADYALLALLALQRRRVLTVYLAGIGLAYVLYLMDIQAHTLRAWCGYSVSSFVLMIVIAFLAFGNLLFDPARGANL